MRYLALAALGVLVWLLLVISEMLGKSLDAARSGTKPGGTYIFPVPVIISWALVAIAYVVDSRGSSHGPVSSFGFWLVALLLSALAIYAAGWCIYSLVALRAHRRHTVQ